MVIELFVKQGQDWIDIIQKVVLQGWIPLLIRFRLNRHLDI